MTDFVPFHFSTDDGLRLYGRRYGEETPDRIPVVCLSGLSRNSRDFHQFASRLTEGERQVFTLDYRGRGQSDWDPDPANYNVGREAQDVLQAMVALNITRADFVGTSRGGLILHVLIAIAPDVINSVTLNDIGPVLSPAGLAHIRDYLGRQDTFASLDSVVDHLKAVHEGAFTVLGKRDWREMAEAIYRQRDGLWIADFDPALVQPLRDMDLSKPLPDLWAQFDLFNDKPLLIVRGENSTLLTIETLGDMIARHAGGDCISASGQGHAPLLHHETIFEAIAEFLQ